MTAKLRDMFVVLAFQHGEHDGCEAPSTFATEAEALGYASQYASEIPYTKEHEHECVVFKAISSYRGHRIVPKRHDVEPA